MAQAEYHQLGKSGLRVSIPILGGMTWGNPVWTPWVLSEDKALPLIKAAWDSGVNTLDTANVYSNGESERIIGLFLKNYNIPRERVVILTKIHFLVGNEASTFTLLNPGLASTRDYVNQSGLSRTAIYNQVDACLKRLNTSYIDLLQIHTFDPLTPIEETMKALHDLVIVGKVRYLGACNLRTWQLVEMNRVAEVNGWTPFVSVQVEHSLLYRPEELEMFEYCKFKGIGILSYSPLMDGNLARPIGTTTPRTINVAGTFYDKPRRACDEEIIRRVSELASRLQWTMAQVALAWSRTKVSSPIVGANTVERLLECIPTGKVLDESDISYLEQPYEYQMRRW